MTEHSSPFHPPQSSARERVTDWEQHPPEVIARRELPLPVKPLQEEPEKEDAS
jgi:hypothetical protein